MTEQLSIMDGSRLRPGSGLRPDSDISRLKLQQRMMHGSTKGRTEIVRPFAFHVSRADGPEQTDRCPFYVT